MRGTHSKQVINLKLKLLSYTLSGVTMYDIVFSI